MKITYHVPTEQFGFVEVEMDGADNIPYNDVKSLYGLPVASSEAVGSGLEVKVFNASLDEYLTSNTLKDGANLYQQMSPDQQRVFQEMKKSMKRIEAKNK